MGSNSQPACKRRPAGAAVRRAVRHSDLPKYRKCVVVLHCYTCHFIPRGCISTSATSPRTDGQATSQSLKFLGDSRRGAWLALSAQTVKMPCIKMGNVVATLRVGNLLRQEQQSEHHAYENQSHHPRPQHPSARSGITREYSTCDTQRKVAAGALYICSSTHKRLQIKCCLETLLPSA